MSTISWKLKKYVNHDFSVNLMSTIRDFVVRVKQENEEGEEAEMPYKTEKVVQNTTF